MFPWKFLLFTGVATTVASTATAGESESNLCSLEIDVASSYIDHLGDEYSDNPVIQSEATCSLAPFVSGTIFFSSDLEKIASSPLKNKGSEAYVGVTVGDERTNFSAGYSKYAGDRKGDFIFSSRVPVASHLSFGAEHYLGQSDLTALGLETHGLRFAGGDLTFGIWGVMPRDDDSYVSFAGDVGFMVMDTARIGFGGSVTSDGNVVGAITITAIRA